MQKFEEEQKARQEEFRKRDEERLKQAKEADEE
jgi:hypothetical protein